MEEQKEQKEEDEIDSDDCSFSSMKFSAVNINLTPTKHNF